MVGGGDGGEDAVFVREGGGDESEVDGGGRASVGEVGWISDNLTERVGVCEGFQLVEKRGR